MAASQVTSRTVETLPYRPSSAGWCAYWHGTLRGFGVRVTDTGRRAYIVSYRLRGAKNSKLRTLGGTATLTFGQAMERAREVLEAARAGRDWFDDIRRERAQTMGHAWQYYSEGWLATDQVSPITRRDAAGLWRNHCAREFEKCALADISVERARDWHKRITRDRGPYVANRAAQALRAAWNFGAEAGRVPKTLGNAFAAIRLNKEQARKVILEPHQFPTLAQALNAIENPWARAYLWLLFYTGCRKTELLKLQWTDVEILPAIEREPPQVSIPKRGTLLLRETKGREPRRVALTEPAVEILEGVPRTENPYVFAGTRTNKHPDLAPLDPAPFWREARKAAGLPELRMHDLRRSFGSWLGAQGVAPKMIGTVLGHKTDITSRVYVQLGEAASIKQLLADQFAALAKQAAEQFSGPKAQVIDIAKARG